jgi:hypothetical protein
MKVASIGVICYESMLQETKLASCEDLEAFHDHDYISALANATPAAVAADSPVLKSCEPGALAA